MSINKISKILLIIIILISFVFIVGSCKNISNYDKISKDELIQLFNENKVTFDEAINILNNYNGIIFFDTEKYVAQDIKNEKIDKNIYCNYHIDNNLKKKDIEVLNNSNIKKLINELSFYSIANTKYFIDFVQSDDLTRTKHGIIYIKEEAEYINDYNLEKIEGQYYYFTMK